MHQTITTVPEYRIYEYLLVLSPTSELWEQILFLKKDFAGRYKAWLAAGTKPHITLVYFLAYLRTEERIIYRLKTIGESITPFNVGFKNFGAFSSSVIYANVENKAPVQYLVQELKQVKSLLKLTGGLAPIFVDTPHLTICRNLSPWQFQNGWNDYSTRSFSGNFTANRMTLLRRPYKQKGYATVGEFIFQSMPGLPKQGSLFV